MRTNNRLSGGQVLLLIGAVAYTTSAALADDGKPDDKPSNEKPQIGDQDTTRPTVGPAPTSNTQVRTFEPKLEDRTIKVLPASSREVTRTSMDKPLIDTYLRTWPEHASKAAKATIAAYGLPNEATPSMFIWIENGPWLRTVVYKDEVVHDFPRSHYDVIENTVRMVVPVSKINDVVAFEGSALVQRTEGLVSVRSNNEAMNYLAINLIYDLANGRKNVLAARKLYARGVVGIAKAEPPADATKLHFIPPDDRAQDPDKPMLKPDYSEPGEKDVEPAVAPPSRPLPSPNNLRGPGGKPNGPKANNLNKPHAPGATPAPTTPPPPVPGPKNAPGSASR